MKTLKQRRPRPICLMPQSECDNGEWAHTACGKSILAVPVITLDEGRVSCPACQMALQEIKEGGAANWIEKN